MSRWLWVSVPASIVALVWAFYLYRWVWAQQGGNARMEEVAEAIREGTGAFIRREYTALAKFVAVISILILVLLPAPLWSTTAPLRNVWMVIAYVFGSAFSALAGYIGIKVATQANVKAAAAATRGIEKAFPVGFRGGAVMGLAVVGTSLLGISLVFWATGDPEVLLGFSFGASSLALFAKAGGGIYTKTADIGADLVGKVELGIPEDDPRNPAVIADNVGDNVGDVAGMGADLFDSNVASIVAAILLGTTLGNVEIPLVFAGIGTVASILGTSLVRVRKGDPGQALNRGTYITCVLFGAGTLGASYYMGFDLRIWWAAMVGLLAGVVIGITSEYFTSDVKPPVRMVAGVSQSGPALNIITGFSYGLMSVLPPLVGIGIASAAAYTICNSIGPGYGLFGISIAALGMLSIVGMVISNDAYGPIVDNARGIVEQAGLDETALAVTDDLDSAGNTAKAITKGFAIAAAGLTVIALLAAYQDIVRRATGKTIVFDLMDPLVFLGAIVGLAVPAVFSAMLMLGVGRNANRMIAEIRRQFREIPGLREGLPGVKPDYASCVDIATKGALQELLPATAVAIIATLLVGFIGGVRCLGGYLAGNIFSGLLLALLMANAGGLWDNAKKLVEAGEFGGKGSDAHKAAVVGDTVGDPFKDTAGPSLNTLITVTSLISSLTVTLMVTYSLFK